MPSMGAPTDRVIVKYSQNQVDPALACELLSVIRAAASGVTVVHHDEYDREASAAVEEMASRVLELPAAEIRPALLALDAGTETAGTMSASEPPSWT